MTWHDGAGWSAPWPVTLDSANTLVVAFGGRATPGTRAALAELARRMPHSVKVGCSTAGEIAAARVHDDSIVLAVARFGSVRLRKVVRSLAVNGDAFDTGGEIGRELGAADLRAVLVLCDGLRINGSRLAAGINSTLPPDVTVAGGLSADGDRFGTTWVLDDGEPAIARAVAVGFYGERLRLGHGCHAGWSAFGPERTITRSAGNVLYELDGKPALSLYRAYLGERSAGLPATALLFPLAVREPLDAGPPIVRTILGMNASDESLTFAGSVPEGYRARFMRTRTEHLIQSAGLAGARAAEVFGEDSRPLAIAVSCVGRRLVLGERTEEEIENVFDALPRHAVQVGFYAYGEFGRRHRSDACDLHNQTMTVTLFDEAA